MLALENNHLYSIYLFILFNIRLIGVLVVVVYHNTQPKSLVQL